MDDELEKLRPPGMPNEMMRWNIEDLKLYKITMQEEISKVEALITEKEKVQATAAGLFGGQDNNRN